MFVFKRGLTFDKIANLIKIKSYQKFSKHSLKGQLRTIREYYDFNVTNTIVFRKVFMLLIVLYLKTKFSYA
jgi:site-specific recombinase XerD